MFIFSTFLKIDTVEKYKEVINLNKIYIINL